MNGTKKTISHRISPLVIDVGHVLGNFVHEVDDEAPVPAALRARFVLDHQERLVLERRKEGGDEGCSIQSAQTDEADESKPMPRRHEGNGRLSCLNFRAVSAKGGGSWVPR